MSSPSRRAQELPARARLTRPMSPKASSRKRCSRVEISFVLTRLSRARRRPRAPRPVAASRSCMRNEYACFMSRQARASTSPCCESFCSRSRVLVAPIPCHSPCSRVSSQMRADGLLDVEHVLAAPARLHRDPPEEPERHPVDHRLREEVEEHPRPGREELGMGRARGERDVSVDLPEVEEDARVQHRVGHRDPTHFGSAPSRPDSG